MDYSKQPDEELAELERTAEENKGTLICIKCIKEGQVVDYLFYEPPKVANDILNLCPPSILRNAVTKLGRLGKDGLTAGLYTLTASQAAGGHGDPSTKNPKSRGTKSKLPSCYEDDAPLFMKHKYGHTPSDVASKPKDMAMAQLQKGQPRDLQFHDNDLGPLLANGRCARARCHPEVLHSAFAQGAKILSTPAEDLDVEDWEVYLTFLEVMEKYHLDEDALVEALTPKINALLEKNGLPHFLRHGDSDGMVQCSHAGAILVYLEFKHLVGNPDLQLARYVQDRLKEVRQAGSASWKSTNMPAVGLCITGNSLRLSAYWIERCVCATELAVVDLCRDSGLESRRRAAGLLKAFTIMTKSLDEFYARLQNGDLNVQHGKKVRWQSLPESLAYHERFIVKRVLRPFKVFLVVDVATGAKHVTKFVPKESVAIQELWASQHLAPKILEKDLEFSPSFAKIDMHYCDPKEGWICCANLSPEEFRDYQPYIRKALLKAHSLKDKNGRLIGHGDIRPANICVKLSKKRQVIDVWFLDFDWAGPIGIARYLTPINPEIAEGLKRPKEVVLGALLDQGHDLNSLDAVLGHAEYSSLFESGASPAAKSSRKRGADCLTESTPPTPPRFDLDAPAEKFAFE